VGTHVPSERLRLDQAKKRVVEAARDALRDIYNFCTSAVICLYIASSTVTALEIAVRLGAGRTSVLKVPVCSCTGWVRAAGRLSRR